MGCPVFLLGFGTSPAREEYFGGGANICRERLFLCHGIVRGIRTGPDNINADNTNDVMGKKAVGYLLYNFLILATIGIFLLAVGGWRAPQVDLPGRDSMYSSDWRCRWCCSPICRCSSIGACGARCGCFSLWPRYCSIRVTLPPCTSGRAAETSPARPI